MSSHEHDAWFSREIEKLGPTLFRVAFAILRNRTDCEDAAQNAVLKAYRTLGSLKQRSYFKTWLISILKNECFDMLKRRRPTLDVAEQALSYEMAVPDLDLNQAFDALSPEERLTITLYYYEGYDTREIAQLTEVSEGTVRSRLSRARASLRSQLQEKEAAR